MNTATEVLNALEFATKALHQAAQAAITFSRGAVKDAEARAADPDDWTRLPVSPDRCHVSNFGRTTLIRKATESATPIPGKIRMGARWISKAR